MISNKAHVDYDRVAPTYDRRYAANKLEGVAGALTSLARRLEAPRILEAGCGTGRWLAGLQPLARQIFGLDLSLGMLKHAQKGSPGRLVCGRAAQLPFPAGAFDLIFCVNAFHHFEDPQVFIREVYRLLKPGGALSITGMDPHRGRDNWYLYQYFEGTYETDLARFPSGGRILDWMAAAGFTRAEWGIAEHIYHTLTGSQVLTDPFLQKNGTSQLVLLTEEAYQGGMEKIKAALAEPNGGALIFPVDISLTILTGWV